jgi:alpha-glucosidase
LDTTWYKSYGAEYMKNNSTFYLPFIPQNADLDRWTIALNATHTNSTSGKTYMEYDVHSLFGHMQAKTTADILNSNKSNNENNPTADFRKLISSTSTFAGTGQYAQHHRAGQRRTWEHMKYSIAQVMNFNMFGIPFTGADVCGAKYSNEKQTEEEQQEICARWYQLSTFYPLARTNRDKAEGGIGIEPYDLPGGNKSHYMMA